MFFKEPLTEWFFVEPKWFFYGIAWKTFWSTFIFKSVSDKLNATKIVFR